MVLVDYAAEHLAPLDRQVQRRAGLAVVAGWSLLAGLVRAVPVVMADVLAEHRPQVPLAVDQHPVGALCSCAAYPSLGNRVRARGPRRRLHYRHALAGEDCVESAGELAVTVPDQEAEAAGPGAEIHDQVAGLLGGPRTVGMGGHAQDVHPPGLHLHNEQHRQTPEEDRVHMKEIAGQQAISLRAQERPPGGIHAPRGRTVPAGAQDPPHRRRADVVAESA